MDYVRTVSEITIVPGQRSAIFTVDVIDDNVQEFTETFDLVMTVVDEGFGNPYINVTNRVADVIILDNDS